MLRALIDGFWVLYYRWALNALHPAHPDASYIQEDARGADAPPRTFPAPARQRPALVNPRRRDVLQATPPGRGKRALLR